MLFLLSLWLHCNESYSGEVYSRCYIENSQTSFTNCRSISLYVHTASLSSAKVVDSNNRELTINPGEQKVFIDTNLTVSCGDEFCALSFWNENRIYDKMFYVNDAAGTVVKMNNETLERTYTLLFDYGMSTKLAIDSMLHSRIDIVGLVSYYNTTTNQIQRVPIYNNLSTYYVFTTPGFLEIRDSKYVPISFRIVIGATLSQAKYFQGATGSGEVAIYKNFTLVRSQPNQKLLNLTMISSTDRTWEHLGWVFSIISALILILTLACIFTLLAVYNKRKKESSSEAADKQNEGMPLENITDNH